MSQTGTNAYANQGVPGPDRLSDTHEKYIVKKTYPLALGLKANTPILHAQSLASSQNLELNLTAVFELINSN